MHEMSAWLVLANVATVATFIGAGLAIGSYYNGQHIKDGVAQLRAMMQEQVVAMQAQHGTMEQHLVAAQAQHGTMEEHLVAMQQTLLAVARGNEGIAQVLDRIDARADARHRETLKHLRTA